MEEMDLELPDGRNLHVYDTGARLRPASGADVLTVFWHHGTPNLGAPPEPLFEASERLGIRWIGFDRPGYGTSTELPGRDFAATAADVAAVADAKGIERFAVMGHSSGGPNALACAALLPDRVVKAVSVSGLAPRAVAEAEGLDWFAGMHSDASLRAAIEGREALVKHQEADEFDPETFTPEDHAMFGGPWHWLITVVQGAFEYPGGPGALADDELANVGAWGFDPAAITVPTLLLHGDADRVVPVSHSEWLARRIASSELRIKAGAGHISVLGDAETTLDWMRPR